MTLNRQHADFSLPLELLTLLATESTPANLSDLAADLGLPKQQAVRKVIGEARQMGYFVNVWLDKSRGICACIAKGSWERAYEAATRYFNGVYP